MLIKRIAVLTAAVSCLLTASVRAQEVTLSAINFLPNTLDYGGTWVKWIEQVNAEGKGKVKIELRPYGSIPLPNIADAVRSGVVDMTDVPPAFYTRLLPWADGIKLATISHAEMLKNGANDWINAQHNKVGLEYLTTWGWGDHFVFYMRDKAVKSIADFKGLKIRGNPAFRAFIEALGADMVATSPSEVTTALERGVVDGLAWHSLTIADQGFFKYIKYRIEPGWYTPNASLMMNLKKWQSLPEDTRKFLKAKAIQLATEYPAKIGKEGNARALRDVTGAGVKILELKGEERAQFLKLAQDVGWAEIEKLDPVNGPKLRSLITK